MLHQRETFHQKEMWRQSSSLVPLPATVPIGDYGEFGLEDFPAGTYPSCSKHDAMNRVTDKADWWRCLACHIGCEWLNT